MGKARVMVLLLLEKLEHIFSQKRNLEIALGVTLLVVVGIISLLFFLSPKKQETKPTVERDPRMKSILEILPQQAQDDLIILAKNTLQQAVFPPYIKAFPTVYKNGKVANPNRYYMTWELEDKTTASMVVTYKNIGVLDLVNILFLPTTVPQAISTSSAATIANTYFSLKVEGTWSCNKTSINTPKNYATLCENFWTDTHGIKKGIAITLPDSQKENYGILYCEIYPGSKLYAMTSCSAYGSQK